MRKGLRKVLHIHLSDIQSIVLHGDTGVAPIRSILAASKLRYHMRSEKASASLWIHHNNFQKYPESARPCCPKPAGSKWHQNVAYIKSTLQHDLNINEVHHPASKQAACRRSARLASGACAGDSQVRTLTSDVALSDKPTDRKVIMSNLWLQWLNNIDRSVVPSWYIVCLQKQGFRCASYLYLLPTRLATIIMMARGGRLPNIALPYSERRLGKAARVHMCVVCNHQSTSARDAMQHRLLLCERAVVDSVEWQQASQRAHEYGVEWHVPASSRRASPQGMHNCMVSMLAPDEVNEEKKREYWSVRAKVLLDSFKKVAIEQDVADTEIENESDEEEAQLSGGVDVCGDADMAL